VEEHGSAQLVAERDLGLVVDVELGEDEHTVGVERLEAPLRQRVVVAQTLDVDALHPRADLAQLLDRDRAHPARPARPTDNSRMLSTRSSRGVPVG
jgi:hypothetical protein